MRYLPGSSLAAIILLAVCQSTCATPIEASNHLPRTDGPPAALPATLSRRGEQVTEEFTDPDSAHRGTLHCFDGGSFVTADDLQSAWQNPCLRDFNFAPNAAGQHDPLTSDVTFTCLGTLMLPADGWGPPKCDGKDDFHVLFDAHLAANTKHATSDECQWVYSHIAQGCHGVNSYSRGGWFQFQDDGTTYGMDPTDPDAHNQ
ncbi:MAG: hypothetical protein Q9202_006845 [Teloschistes flavicans]